MDEGRRDSPEGLWDACDQMEANASRVLNPKIGIFRAAIRDCYEAGVEAPTLMEGDSSSQATARSALFLKRTLTDLRAVWLLVRIGYASQAASIAASLFENALAVVALTEGEDRFSELERSPSGDIPWSPTELSKALARRRQLNAHSWGREFSGPTYERAWRETYGAYKWLCKVKHPTTRSAVHDAGATSLRQPSFVVMAAPDVRDENLSLKATVLMISISRVLDAVEYFVRATPCHEGSARYQKFMARVSSANNMSIEAFKSTTAGPLPFSISEEKLARDYKTLRESDE